MLPCSGRAFNGVGCFGNGASSVAAGNAFGRHDETTGRHSFFNGQNRREFFDQHLGFVGSFAGIEHVTRNDYRHSLADKFHFAICQERVVMDDWAAVVFAWDIFGGVDRHHAVFFQNSFAVNAVTNQLAVRYGRQNQRGIKRAGQFRNIVDVGGRTRDMQVCRFMHQLFALLHVGGGQKIFQVGRSVHLCHLRSVFFNKFKYQISGH